MGPRKGWVGSEEGVGGRNVGGSSVELGGMAIEGGFGFNTGTLDGLNVATEGEGGEAGEISAGGSA